MLRIILRGFVFLFSSVVLFATEIVTNPFVGVMLITRTETVPRNETIHLAVIDLNAPGIRFQLTAPGGTMETVRQTTLDYLNQEHAQLAVNSHFFLPFPSTDVNASLIGIAASNGIVYSAFESPVQSYALVINSPGLNIDSQNNASIVHADTAYSDGKHVREPVTLWTAVSGSAQIITDGVVTIPKYRDSDNPDASLTPGGPGNYSNGNSWYELTNARTVIGLSQDNRTLFLFTVDNAGGSRGMRVSEVAEMLIRDYGVYNALNLDGGGSTSMAMEDPATQMGRFVNVSSDNPNGRAEGSNLAVFAILAPEPSTVITEVSGLLLIVVVQFRRRH